MLDTTKVLLIEDNPGHTDLILRRLAEETEFTYDVTCAGNLSDGLKQVHSAHFDVVLLDLFLPDSTNIDTLDRFVSDAPNVAVVVLTSLDDDFVGMDSVRMGAQDYLIKRELHGEFLPRSIRYAIERKRIDIKLRASEEKYRDLVENLNDAVFSLDHNGAITYISPPIELISGFAPAEIIGRSAADLIHSEDARSALERLLKHQESAPITKEIRIATKSGKIRWALISARSISNGNGAGIRGVITDITDWKESKSALRESEERFRVMFDNSRDLITITSMLGKMLWVNPAWKMKFGFTPETQSGPFAGVHPEYREKVRAAWKDMLTGEDEITDLEFSCETTGGERLFLEATARKLTVSGKSFIYLAAHDITAMKRSQKRISKINECFLGFGPDSIRNINCLAQLCGELSGADFVTYCRLDEGHLLNIGGWRIPPDFEFSYDKEKSLCYQIIISGDDKPILTRNLHDNPALKVDPNITKFNLKTCFCQAIKHKGEPVGALCLYYRKEIIPDQYDEKVLGIVASAIAVEEERNRAEKLSLQLVTAVEQSGEIIMMTGVDGRIQNVNPAFEEITGYTRREAIGRNPNILKSGKQDAAFYRELWDTVTNGEVWRGRLINMKKDGTLFEEDAVISPVYDSMGKIFRYVAVKRDVTREVELAKQLRQSIKMEAVGRLAGGVAHDFNNLLTAIIGYSDFLIKQLGPKDARRAIAEQIKGAGGRAASLTKQLLAFSRKQVLKPEILDLNVVVNNMNSMLRRIIGEDIELVSTPCPDVGKVEADESQIESIILNLAVNARDAMPDGGKLIIETSNADLDKNYFKEHPAGDPGPYVRMTITDSGCGMTRETIDHAFDPFFTTKEQGKGTGLGLSSVYGIIKQSNGYIWVYSEPGKGTTFKIYLPRIDGEVKPKLITTTSTGFFAGDETILLAEDEDAVRNLTTEILQQCGYTVLSARSPRQAIRIAEQYSGFIDLLLTDMVMPGMNGRELAQSLNPLFPNMPVIYMSGYTSDSIVRQGELEPDVVFIEKPWTSDLLLRTIRRSLNVAKEKALVH